LKDKGHILKRLYQQQLNIRKKKILIKQLILCIRNAARTALELDAEASKKAKLFMENIQILAS
tara:strand:- start:332 stop:520 length:189 start_codon:yes stop_codon:yes gene_type:complete